MHFVKKLSTAGMVEFGLWYRVGSDLPHLYALCGKQSWRYDVTLPCGGRIEVEAPTKRQCIAAMKREIRKVKAGKIKLGIVLHFVRPKGNLGYCQPYKCA